METIFKGEQINLISSHLSIPKTVVYDILTEYVEYLKGKLNSGETVKFLNVCYIRVNGKNEEIHETLAYVSNEIGKIVGQSQNVTYRVLTTYEEILIKELQKLNSYSVRGLFRIKLEKDYQGIFRVRVKKSTIYNGIDIYVTAMPSFKRRAEVV